MKRFILASLVSLLGLTALAPGSASAQMSFPPGPPRYGPYYQPMLSPYLNMLRGGDPNINYFMGVLPETQRRQDVRTFSRYIQDLEEREAVTTAEEEGLMTPLSSTGHPTAFGYTGSYFGPGTARPPTSRQQIGRRPTTSGMGRPTSGPPARQGSPR